MTNDEQKQIWLFMDSYDSKLNDMEIEKKSNKKDRKMDDGSLLLEVCLSQQGSVDG